MSPFPETSVDAAKLAKSLFVWSIGYISFIDMQNPILITFSFSSSLCIVVADFVDPSSSACTSSRRLDTSFTANSAASRSACSSEAVRLD